MSTQSSTSDLGAAETVAAHPELQLLRIRLQKIYDSISHYPPLTAKPPILDSSQAAEVKRESNDDSQLLHQEHIPGLKKLRDMVKVDLDVLEKFFNDPKSAHLPPLSTNAPYLIAVWNEVLCAPSPIVSIFKLVPSNIADPMADPCKPLSQKPPVAKVDIVADNGRRWIRVNTVKNSRMLAEFREIDSYFTDSDSDSDESSVDGQPTLAQTEFDNSVLRMGRSLLAAAKTNPIDGTTESPKVTIRLTRLDPSMTNESGEANDPRIAETLHRLQDMGIDVELGERENVEMPLEKDPVSAPLTTTLEPTTRLNLDLSVLIALVSDLTHSPLPISIDGADTRFVPPRKYRKWKQQKAINGTGNSKEKANDTSIGLDEEVGDITQDLAKHSRALTNQVLQEMNKGLLQEMHDRLVTKTGSGNSLSSIELWTSPEARDRCLRIVSKIGGVNEKRRANALFPSASSFLCSEPLLTLSQAEEAYWRNSRYPQGYVPLLPIRLYPSSIPEDSIRHPPLHVNDPSKLPTFFKSLGKTCRDILAQETIPHPYSLPDDFVKGEEGAKIQRATVMKANARLTAHTVQSMWWGADLGWTTLTANRSSVKAILREIKAAKIAGRIDGDFGPAVNVDPPKTGTRAECRTEESDKAAIWIVDPRSLAEGMRADYDV